VDVELRPIASEETANARVERSARAAAERIDAERKRVEEERDWRCRVLSARVDEAIARILADAEHDVTLRRVHRERSFVGIFRNRPRKKTL